VDEIDEFKNFSSRSLLGGGESHFEAVKP